MRHGAFAGSLDARRAPAIDAALGVVFDLESAELARRMLLHERVILRVHVMQHRIRLHRRIAEAHVHRPKRHFRHDGGEKQTEAECEQAEADEFEKGAHREELPDREHVIRSQGGCASRLSSPRSSRPSARRARRGW